MNKSIQPVIFLAWCKALCSILSAFLCGIGATVFPLALVQTGDFPHYNQGAWIILSGSLLFLNEFFVGHLFYHIVRKNKSLQQASPSVGHKVMVKLVAILPFAVWAVGCYIGYFCFSEEDWHLMPPQH